jgi:hypothetical protein
MKHERSAFLHARERAWERYLFNFTFKRHEKFLKIIHAGKAVKIDDEETHHDRIVYDIPFFKKKYRVIYSPDLDVIVTFIPGFSEHEDFYDGWEEIEKVKYGKGNKKNIRVKWN